MMGDQGNDCTYALFISPAIDSGVKGVGDNIVETTYITVADFHKENMNKIFTFICDIESLKVSSGSRLWRPNRFTTRRVQSDIPISLGALYAVRSDVLNTIVTLTRRYGIQNVNDELFIQMESSITFSPSMINPVDYLKWYLVMVEQDSNGVMNWLGVKVPLYAIHKYIKLEPIKQE